MNGKTTCRLCGAVFSYEPILFGEKDLALSVELHCPECSAELEHQAEEQKRAQTTMERLELFRRTVPPSLWPVSLEPEGTDTESPEFNLPLWHLVNRWRPSRNRDRLALIGPPEQSKTRCLGLLAHDLIMRGNRMFWTDAMHFHDEATFNLRSRDRVIQTRAIAYIQECKTIPWLVLDDLSNNEWSSAFETQLFAVLDYRMTHFLPMAFSSNMSFEDMRKRITKVDPTAFIGRLINRATVFDCTPDSQPLLPKK